VVVADGCGVPSRLERAFKGRGVVSGASSVSIAFSLLFLLEVSPRLLLLGALGAKGCG